MRQASPFGGEFGWEVMMWSPWLRHMKATRVFSSRGHERLYDDFAEEILEQLIPMQGEPDCQHRLWEGRRAPRMFYTDNQRKLTPLDLPVQSLPDGCPRMRSLPEHFECVHLGRGGVAGTERHVYMHARDYQKQADRNWPLDAWNNLLSLVHQEKLDILPWAIGTRQHATKPLACADARDVSVADLADAMSGRVVVGPSSGPMCVALLAPAKGIVTWSGNAKDKTRFASEWNPFDVPVTLLPEWQPSPRSVLNALAAFFK